MEYMLLFITIYFIMVMINTAIVVKNLIKANEYVVNQILYPAIERKTYDKNKHNLDIIIKKFYYSQYYMTLNPLFFFISDWRIVIKDQGGFLEIINELLPEEKE